MKKTLYFVAIASMMLLASCGSNKPKEVTYTLDLEKATPALTFDQLGLWSGTYDLETKSLICPPFSFQHSASESEYMGMTYVFYSGFTACTNTTADATGYENVAAKKALAGEGKPYMVGYWADTEYDGVTYRTTDIKFDTIAAPKYVYLCNTAAAVKAIKEGDDYSTAFTEGDYFLITIMALDADGKILDGQKVDYYLADFRDGKTFVNEDWEKVDLTALGECNGITFKMVTTDVVSYDGGTTYYANTPTYFGLDGLTIGIKE